MEDADGGSRPPKRAIVVPNYKDVEARKLAKKPKGPLFFQPSTSASSNATPAASSQSSTISETTTPTAHTTSQTPVPRPATPPSLTRPAETPKPTLPPPTLVTAPVRPSSPAPRHPDSIPPERPALAVRRSGGNAIIVNAAQRGNPILQHIRNVPWEYGDVLADYVVGNTSAVLYLSLRYHRLHPEYIHDRISKLRHKYILRVVLILVDIDNHQEAIREVTRSAVLNEFTVMLAWSKEEAGRYLETYKAFEHKPPDMIKERVESDYMAKLTDTLTQIRSVNKTDVLTLISTFGSLKNIMNASAEELALCPGFGEQKVRQLQEAFNQPFRVKVSSRTTKPAQ